MSRAHNAQKLIILLLLLLLTGLAQAQSIKVTGADPAEAEQGAGLSEPFEVMITGEGFDRQTRAKFLVAGSRKDTGGITVTGNRYENPGLIVATIEVAVDAYVGSFDIELSSSRGRRGKGNTLFSVKLKESGNTNPYDGEDIALDCRIVNSLQDDQGIAVDNNVLHDGDDLYREGVDKVSCRIGGTVQPNPSGIALSTVSKGPLKRAIRKIDLALGPCVGEFCGHIPAELLGLATSFETLQDVTIAASPYPEQDYIQLMEPGEHPFSLRIAPKGYANRYTIQLMGRVIPPEFHQGVYCDLEQNPDLSPYNAISDDVSVFIWPRQGPVDLPAGYTITTGAIADASVTPPVIEAGSRLGAVCSNDGPQVCGGPSNGDLCNLLGFVEVRLTIHATNQ
jgi:hypothetical protein